MTALITVIAVIGIGAFAAIQELRSRRDAQTTGRRNPAERGRLSVFRLMILLLAPVVVVGLVYEAARPFLFYVVAALW